MKIKHLLFTFFIVFNSCDSSKKADKKNDNKIIGAWELSEVITFNKENLAIEEETKAKLGRELLEKGLTLRFFPDSTYAVLKDSNIKHGKWSSFADKEIRYGNNRLRIEKFEDGELDKNLLVNLRNEDTNIELDLEFVEAEKMLENYKEDPFHFSNNKWRERPLKKETNKEIATRLANYIVHNAYVLKAAHERNTGAVTFKHSQGVIKIYQGAIGIVKENKINASWLNYYYDKEDAMKAFYLYKSYLGKEGVYKMKSTGDWVKDDYTILLKLYAQIKQIKETDSERFKKN